MKSALATKLKAILDNMTQAEFDKEWSAVTALNLNGPTFDEAIEYFTIMQDQLSRFELNTPPSNSIVVGEDYALAA